MVKLFFQMDLPPPVTKSNNNGFTLVELAIALMVIGLLIGGVLKGQELIENARVTATIRDIKSYDSAAMIFRNSYGALPGDFRHPSRIPGCSESLCTVSGNGNGRVGDQDHETYNFFPHLTLAGLIKGPTGGSLAQKSALEPFMGTGRISDDDMLTMNAQDDAMALAALGDTPSAENLNDIATAGGLRIRDNLEAQSATESPDYVAFFPHVPLEGTAINVVNNGRNNHSYRLNPLSVFAAQQIDNKMDDGFANTGSITDGSATQSAQNILGQADGSNPRGSQPEREEPRPYDISGRGGDTQLFFKAQY